MIVECEECKLPLGPHRIKVLCAACYAKSNPGPSADTLAERERCVAVAYQWLGDAPEVVNEIVAAIRKGPS